MIRHRTILDSADLGSEHACFRRAKQASARRLARRPRFVLSNSTEPGPRALAWLPKAAVGDTQPTMPEESTTPDLVERVRGLVGALDRCDVDTVVSFLAPDAVLAAEVGRFEGVAAIRGFLEDWLANYEEFAATLEEVRDLGNGVTFSVILQHGRLVGSSGQVQLRHAMVNVWVDGFIARTVTDPDIDEARAAAERLAEERE